MFIRLRKATTFSIQKIEVNGRMVSTFYSKIGLGGIQERFTLGETLWYMASMLMLGIGLGFVIGMLLLASL